MPSNVPQFPLTFIPSGKRPISTDRLDQIQIRKQRAYRPGQTVWVLGLKDILNTLDSDGKLDGLPFMPEMLDFCGRSFRVSCRPNRTCVEGAGICEFEDVVFLDGLRCDGSAHDGCQRRCLLFWREAWLSDVPPAQSAPVPTAAAAAAKAGFKTRKGERYFCQSTELAGAATAYPDEAPSLGKRLGRDLCDLQLGNISLMDFSGHVLGTLSNRLKDLAGIDAGYAVYGSLQKTLTSSLHLQPGDLVEIKSRKEIEATLDVSGKNRGLLFTPPMLRHCGKRYRIANQLKRMILEETGKMIELRDTVVLEGVTCQTWGCRRSNLQFWREIWLERVES